MVQIIWGIKIRKWREAGARTYNLKLRIAQDRLEENNAMSIILKQEHLGEDLLGYFCSAIL